MSVALNEMVARLTADVPAQDAVPSATQYQNAIKAAVTAYNAKVGRKKLYEFATVGGTAAYNLPSDFFKLIELTDISSGARYGDVVVNDSGLIPLNEGVSTEVHTIAGRALTIIPTPSGAVTRYLWYRAGHVLSGAEGSEVYADMLDHEADIILVKATANAWRVVATKAQRSNWKYKQGDVEIDKSNAGKAMKDWIRDLDSEFDQLVSDLIGTVGVMA
ncbi:MAG: hypothetical protein GY943_16740 [Chloroflexi bacterium]|nr:hypothetical protein [Chloroflexota bacterium]